jgi:hypothetical protein
MTFGSCSTPFQKNNISSLQIGAFRCRNYENNPTRITQTPTHQIGPSTSLCIMMVNVNVTQICLTVYKTKCLQASVHQLGIWWHVINTRPKQCMQKSTFTISFKLKFFTKCFSCWVWSQKHTGITKVLLDQGKLHQTILWVEGCRFPWSKYSGATCQRHPDGL